MASAWAQAKKSVFLISDAEGVAGVCRQDQTDPKDSEMRQLLTGEINAAVEGFLSGGASEVVVWDGHDGSQTLSALTIHPAAKLLMGAMGPSMTMERGYAAVAFVGQHGRANSRGGVLAHSYSSLGIQKILMNGKPVGEIETRAALAGWYMVRRAGNPAQRRSGGGVGSARDRAGRGTRGGKRRLGILCVSLDVGDCRAEIDSRTRATSHAKDRADPGLQDRRARDHRGGIQYALHTEPGGAARAGIGDGGCAHHSISRQRFYGSLDSVEAVLNYSACSSPLRSLAESWASSFLNSGFSGNSRESSINSFSDSRGRFSRRLAMASRILAKGRR